MSQVLYDVLSSSAVRLTPDMYSPDNIPDQRDIEYYRQQAAFGPLLITESSLLNNFTWSLEQIEAWKKVTDAVHEIHSHIYLQLNAFANKSSTPQPLTRGQIKANVGWFSKAAENAVAAGFDGVDYSMF